MIERTYICPKLEDFIACQKYLITLGYSWASHEKGYIYEPTDEGETVIFLYKHDMFIGMTYSKYDTIRQRGIEETFNLRERKMSRILK